jgi:tetratricopeptide (TPR) repeat protein
LGFLDRLQRHHDGTDAGDRQASFTRRPQEFDAMTERAYRLLEAEDPDLDAVQACFTRAAACVGPGDDRAYALGQAATVALRAERPRDSVEALMSDIDWPHHVPASFDCLMRAAVAAEDLEPFRWLAQREARYHEPSLAWVDRGVSSALREQRFTFAERLVELVGGLGDAPLQALLHGQVLEKEGREGDAIESFRRAAELGSADPRAFRRLTLLLDRAKRRDESAEWCRRALRLDLDAAARAEIEKRLARLQAPAGRKRDASAGVIPLYPRKGNATIERLASAPVALTEASVADGVLWGTAMRKGSPHLFSRAPAENVELEWALGLTPLTVCASSDGRCCLVMGPISADDKRWRGMVASLDGGVVDLGLLDVVSAVVTLADRWLTASRDGPVQAFGLGGEPRWTASLPGGVFPYHFAADSQRVLATHTDRIFELDPNDGALRGSSKIPEKPEVTSSVGPVTISMSFGEQASWPRGLGIAAGRGWLIASDQLFEVAPGARLIGRERYEGYDYPSVAVVDRRGALLAFKGNEQIAVVGPDGLRPPIPCPWSRRDLSRLSPHRLASFGGNVLALIDEASGQETHLLEAASKIGAVDAGPDGAALVAVGRDLLLVSPE